MHMKLLALVFLAACSAADLVTIHNGGDFGIQLQVQEPKEAGSKVGVIEGLQGDIWNTEPGSGHFTLGGTELVLSIAEDGKGLELHSPDDDISSQVLFLGHRLISNPQIDPVTCATLAPELNGALSIEMQECDITSELADTQAWWAVPTSDGLI
ncbi:hypothetical protein NP233_g12783 [Leucocoprinus birnbaumii]|uniref:Uncharacterized protein n=1 Tax=Leucocoprinus birnbaumii TaxID=56174 RepID=A0AAD5VDS8_9AGAR|nr:hypothetical protein NP233_g12783 [Leucocoprinus birnbaumii]